MEMAGWIAPSSSVGMVSDRLSDREVQVLRLIASGLSNKDIAVRLVLSVHTVERHLSNIYAKIGARTRTDAATYAIERRIAPHADRIAT